jgi:DNA-binding NarL/FixJ family response regulator
VDAIRLVAGGCFVLGPEVGTTILTEVECGPAALPPPLDTLTERERDVLAAVARGESNAQIAGRRGVSEKTISNQMGQIFTKVGVANRLQAAVLAREAGLHVP